MTIEALHPLIYFKSMISDSHYIIADGKWQEVDRFYSMAELNTIWKKIIWKAETKSTESNKTYQVNGSRNSVYEVKCINSNWFCSCPAHAFKKYTDCKHIREIKNQLKL